MKLLSENPWLGEKFRTLRQHDAENPDGFVCVLDLRDLHAGRRTFSIGQLLALSALIAFAVLMVNCWLSSFSEPAPRRDGDTARIIESESPSEFPTDTALPPSPSN